KFAPSNLKIEIITFDSPTDGKNAVVTKSVDFGAFGIAAATLGAAAGEPVVVVGAFCNKGMGVIAKKGSEIKTVKDLKGKKVGIWPGSTQEVFIMERLRLEGMSIKDVVATRVPFGEMHAMLSRGDID
ncbi:MAG TPA: ABC transporter substrate-binding protein, partial [Rhabdaerophilum sp.]|nr:ABC transporter substrate-binding protein [Rhabdaerophilum sp.]